MRKDDKPPMNVVDESEHDKLVSRAYFTIRAVAADHNVTLEHSARSLQSLKAFIDTQLDILEKGH